MARPLGAMPSEGLVRPISSSDKRGARAHVRRHRNSIFIYTKHDPSMRKPHFVYRGIAKSYGASQTSANYVH